MTMKHLTTCLTLVLVVLLLPSVARSQTRPLTYKNRDYALDLPSAKWRAITVTGIAQDRTEFRYGERSQIHLRIRRELVDANVSPADLVQRQQRLDRVFLLGYVKGKDEIFAGRLSGAKYPYEYVKTGKPMLGIIYYLEADNRIIYRLEFTGSPDKLRNLSDQTEFIARSFRLL